MRFSTVVNCMDGRVQLPVIRYMQKRFKTDYIDSITEPGPNLILSENTDQSAVLSILNRVGISLEKHKSSAIAIVGHYDCAGNPLPKDEQIQQLKKSVKLLKNNYSEVEIIALWVDEKWVVNEI